MFFKGRFELAPYGEEFVNSYVVLKFLDKNQIVKFTKRVAEAEKKIDKEEDTEKLLEGSTNVIELVYSLVADQFVEGSIFDNGEQRPMRKVDIEMFPPAIVKDLSRFVQGAYEKKA